MRIRSIISAASRTGVKSRACSGKLLNFEYNPNVVRESGTGVSGRRRVSESTLLRLVARNAPRSQNARGAEPCRRQLATGLR
jgi:hypothetical protein